MVVAEVVEAAPVVLNSTLSLLPMSVAQVGSCLIVNIHEIKEEEKKNLCFTFLSVTQREVEKPWETNIGSSHQELNKTKTTKKNPSGLVDARPGVAISAKTLHEPVTQPSI